MIINTEQEKVIKRIFQLLLEGVGAYSIAKILNEEQIPVKSAEFKGRTMNLKNSYTKETKLFNRDDVRWRGNVISGIIRNKIYKGVWALNKGKDDEIVRSSPQIITPEVHDNVIDNLAKNRTNVGKREHYQYLLNGLVFFLIVARK